MKKIIFTVTTLFFTTFGHAYTYDTCICNVKWNSYSNVTIQLKGLDQKNNTSTDLYSETYEHGASLKDMNILQDEAFNRCIDERINQRSLNICP